MLKWILAAVLCSASLQSCAAPRSQDTYLIVYVHCHDAEQYETNGAYLEALAIYNVAIFYLQTMRNDPGWETALLDKKIKDLQAKVAELQPKVSKQYNDQSNALDYHAPSLYVFSRDATDAEKKHDYWGALVDFQKCSIILEIIHTEDPKWESAQVEEKIKQIQANIERIESLAAKELEKSWSGSPNSPAH